VYISPTVSDSVDPQCSSPTAFSDVAIICIWFSFPWKKGYYQLTIRSTGCWTQTVASRDRRMDRSHIDGICTYKAKDSFPLRQISLIFIGRFCALKFSVLRSTHRDCILRAKMDLRPIIT
jgi:hypothetical protein